MSYRRKQEENRRLEKLYRKTRHSYGRGVYFDTDKNRLIQYTFSKTSRNPKYLRRRSNKKVRHTTGIPDNSKYKKYFDYWWELY